MGVHRATTQISLGFHSVGSESLLFAQLSIKDIDFLHADSEESYQSVRVRRLV